MKTKTSLSHIIFSGLALSLVTTGIFVYLKSHKASTINNRVIGKVISTNGEPSRRSEGSPFWKPISINQPIAVGDRLKTSNGQSLLVSLQNGQSIQIEPNSMITLQDPDKAEAFKIEIGRSSVARIDTKNTSEMSALIEQLKAEAKKQNQIKLIQNDQEITISKPTITKIELLFPLADSIIPKNNTEKPEITMRWSGPMDGSYEVEYHSKKEGQSLLSTRNQALYKKINYSLATDEIKWRVREKSTNQMSDWQIFRWEILNPPIITAPANFSNLNDTQIKNGLLITWKSSFNQHEVWAESPYINEKVATNLNQFKLKPEWIKKLPIGRETFTLKVRSQSPAGNWTQWSDNLSLIIENTPSLSIQEPFKKIDMACTKRDWKCVNPLLIKLSSESNLIDKSEVYVKWMADNTEFLEKISLKDKSARICPPFPRANWQWKLIETVANKNLIRETIGYQLETKVMAPPNIDLDFTRYLNATDLLVKADYCPNSLLKFEISGTRISSPIDLIIAHSTDSITMEKSQPLKIQTQWLDVNKQALSPKSNSFEINLYNPNLENLKDEEGNMRVVWDLNDAGEIYFFTGQKKAPWTPIDWKSSPVYNQYEYQIASDLQFTQIIETQVQNKNSVNFKLPEKISKIFWRVRGIKGAAITPWSEIRLIEVKNVDRLATSSEGTTR